ncbi:MAG: hypothetical protein AAF224_10205 [Pseudomonadota bacterium]
MSARFPIGAAANEAVQFGLVHWRTVLRYAWAPFLVGGLLLAVFMNFAIDAGALEEGALEAMSLSDLVALVRLPIPVLAFGAIVVITLILYLTAGIQASVFEFVVTGKNRPGLFHLRTDGPTTRTFFAVLILSFMSFGIAVVALLIAQFITGETPGAVMRAAGAISDWVGSARPGQAPPAEIQEASKRVGGFVFTALLIGFAPYVYLSLRLSPLPAGSAVENRLIPLKAFAMTRGYVLPIVGAAGLLFFFIFILNMIFGLATGILDLASTYFLGLGGGAAFMGVLLSLIVAVATIFFQVFVMAVQGAFQGIIYRRLETGE